MNTIYHHALAIGTRIEEFELTAVLGAGGFGVTYKGLDHKFQRDVAIKEYLPGELAMRSPRDQFVIPRSEAEREDYEYGLARFLEEARILAKFNHPNIVKVHRYMEGMGTAYLVMEYGEGQSLAQVLAGRTLPLPEEEIRRILLPVLSGLQVVHEHHYLHRDIKPSNIYLRTDGRPLLIDFGAARHALGEHSRSKLGMMTPGYAPFEQYSVSGKQGPYTDLYAFGATVYRCIANKSPIEASERLEALTDNRPDPYLTAVTIGQGRYSDLLLGVIDWMLQLRTTDRPQSVQEVLEVLEGAPQPVGSGIRFDPFARTVQVSAPRKSLQAPASMMSSKPARALGRLVRLLLQQVAAASRWIWNTPRMQAVRAKLVAFGAKLREFVGICYRWTTTVLGQFWKWYQSNGKAQGLSILAVMAAAVFFYAYYITDWPLKAGDVFSDKLRDGGLGPEMVAIAGGSDPTDDASAQPVALPPSFAMGRYEVTFDDYDRFCASTGREKPADEGWGRDRHPVINVSADDAYAYARWLSRQTGKRYRLPTEVEWEHAARAGVTTNYWWGRVVGANQANCQECGSSWDGASTALAGSFSPSPFGLYDTAGNAAEWTCTVVTGPQPDPDAKCADVQDPRKRIIRGGSWQSPAAMVTAMARDSERPTAKSSSIGFRILLDLPKAK